VLKNGLYWHYQIMTVELPTAWLYSCVSLCYSVRKVITAVRKI